MTENQQLDKDFDNRLLEILEGIPALDNYDSRTLLLRDLPRGPVGGIRRDPARTPDLGNIVEAAKGWGRLEADDWSLVIIARNALRLSRGTQSGAQLKSLLTEFDIDADFSLPPNENEKQWQKRPSSVEIKLESGDGDNVKQVGYAEGNVTFEEVHKSYLSTTSVVFIIATLILAGVLGGGFYLWSQSPPRPDVMTGDFNIAVAQFGEVTQQGLASSKPGITIHEMLVNFLDSEYYNVTDYGLAVEVAYKNIGRLSGKQEAEKLAEDINAHLVIYGTIYENAGEAELTLKFYVADRYWPDALDMMAGEHQLTLPIRFNVSSLDSFSDLSAEMRSRMTILVSFAEGLIYLQSENFAGALRSFQKAVVEAEDRDLFQGQETLYTFLGFTFAILENYDEGMKYFNKALDLNPEYGRAYIGRGNIYYTRAEILGKAGRNYEYRLYQAGQEYERALIAQDHPVGAHVKDKANLGLGNVYLVEARMKGDIRPYEQAIYHYEQIITQYEKTENERLKTITADAYCGLGDIYTDQEDSIQAEKAYQSCLKLADDSRKQYAEERLNAIQRDYLNK